MSEPVTILNEDIDRELRALHVAAALCFHAVQRILCEVRPTTHREFFERSSSGELYALVRVAPVPAVELGLLHRTGERDRLLCWPMPPAADAPPAPPTGAPPGASIN